jgi:uncharacterized protein (DUF983 family)
MRAVRESLTSTAPARRRPGLLEAIARQRCPRCREGPIFRRRLTMYWFCPVCELRILREPGYTTVAIELSYVFTIPILLGGTAFFALVFHLEIIWAAIAAALLFLVLSPFVFRYSRVLWVYLDQRIDPGR